MKGRTLSLLLALVAFSADRLHKFIQVEQMRWPEGTFVPMTPFLDIGLVFNPGISYSLFSNLPVWGLALLAGVALVALGIWWWRAEQALVRAGLAIAIGGALSNAVDRLRYGAVADFFYLHVGDWSFYIFNLGDVAITIGVVLLILDFLGVGRGARRQGA